MTDGWSENQREHTAIGVLLAINLLGTLGYAATGVDDARSIVREAQARRIALVERVRPAVVCVFDQGQQGGGSGVIIDPAGYGVTNYHVVAGMLSTRRGFGALSDGKLYVLEVLGIDPTGDVAMFRLRGRETYDFAELGDSDLVQVGDSVMAMGNPFTLSEDYVPSVTAGLVTGVHRYQWGVGTNLIYSDCLQTDASINPGNSGGPLFNERGEVIGINGRISVNTRGRFNVGHGYAISSNQIRRFIPALRAGLLARHGTLQATVAHAPGSRVVFDNVRANYAGDNAGILIGDRLRFVDGVPIDNPNRFASVLGTYPAGWTVSLSLERNGEPVAVRVRLDPIEPKLRGPFEVDAEVNARETQRVLTAYHRSVLGDERDRALPKRMSWTLTRTASNAPRLPRADETRYAVEFSPGRSVRMRLLDHDGAAARIVEFDDQSATQRRAEEAERFDLAPDESLLLRAVYFAQANLLDPSVTPDAVSLSHGGADAAPVEWRIGSGARHPGVMELLHAPLSGGGSAEFGFDTRSGRLVAIRVEDAPSGMEASVIFHAYRDCGDVNWPTEMRVELPGRGYTDRLSDVEVSR